MDYKEIFDNSRDIDGAYQIIEEWEYLIGYQKIKVKITKDLRGLYYYENSHHYRGSGQADPYRSSENGFETAKEALYSAIQESTFFYNSDDEKARWVKNEDY